MLVKQFILATNSVPANSAWERNSWKEDSSVTDLRLSTLPETLEPANSAVCN